MKEKCTPELVSALHECQEELAALQMVEGLLNELLWCDGRRATISITSGQRWFSWKILNDVGSRTEAEALIKKWLQPWLDKRLFDSVEIVVRYERNDKRSSMNFQVSASPIS